MQNNILRIFVCLSLGLVLAENGKAEDNILQVTPFATTAGITENDWDENLAFTVQMNNTQAYTGIQFDIVLPQGMTLIAEEPLELLRERFPGTVKKGVFYPEHNISVKELGNGHYRIVLWHNEFAPVTGNSGDMMIFYYLTSEDMTPGYYPIKVTGTVLAVNAHNDYKPATSTSYVKIGEPGEGATLTMQGNIPCFVNEALAKETDLSTLDCSQVTNMDGTFCLVDGRNFIPPTGDVAAQSVSYHRDCIQHKWGTVCLPFAVESDANVRYYKLIEVADDKLTFDPVERVEAGQPAVFRILNGDALDIKANNAVLHAGECSVTYEAVNWTLKGSYSTITLDPDASENVTQYYISQDKFWYNNVAVSLKAFRAWFETPKTNYVRQFSLCDSEITTGAQVIEQADGTVEMYFDLSGRCLPHAMRGINIINDKKVIRR